MGNFIGSILKKKFNFILFGSIKKDSSNLCYFFLPLQLILKEDYFALEGRAQWSTARFALLPSRVRSSMCMLVVPAVPYLLPGLAGCSVSREISRGARKLTRTPT